MNNKLVAREFDKLAGRLLSLPHSEANAKLD